MTYIAYKIPKDSNEIILYMDTLTTNPQKEHLDNMRKFYIHEPSGIVVCGTGSLDELAFVIWNLSKQKIDNFEDVASFVKNLLDIYSHNWEGLQITESSTCFMFGFSDGERRFQRWHRDVGSRKYLNQPEHNQNVEKGFLLCRPSMQAFAGEKNSVIEYYMAIENSYTASTDLDEIILIEAMLAESFEKDIVVGGFLEKVLIEASQIKIKTIMTFAINSTADTQSTILDFVRDKGWESTFEVIASRYL